jgi:hypothetical protein
MEHHDSTLGGVREHFRMYNVAHWKDVHEALQEELTDFLEIRGSSSIYIKIC